MSHIRAFLEEAAELLIELEEAVLELEKRPADSDLIQRVFRALHTIKGSGAMFGFDAASRFTHEMETAFDLVREGKLPVTPKLINLTLEGRDLIKALLDRREAVDAVHLASVVEEFKALAKPDVPPAAPSLPEAHSGSGIAESDEPAEGRPHSWRIYFKPPADILQRGMNVLLILRELEDLGELQAEAITDSLPDLESMDPESCYFSWDLRLTTTQNLDAIRDVFVFVEDVSEIHIEPAEPVNEVVEEPALLAVSPEQPFTAEADRATPAESSAAGPEHKPLADPMNARNASIRVGADKLDALVNYVGELVVMQARLSDIALRSNNPETVMIAEEIERLSAGLRDSAMSIRMLPLRGTFDRFRRLVRDLTRDLGKEIEFHTEGGETELDKTVIDQLNDPLLHLIRNCADHGIELPDERTAAGKPRAGNIRLSALYSGANVLIRVADDGRGLNAEKIRIRAIEKGLIPAEAKLSESDVMALILMPGFSTARAVTDLSGRGVGMDVVQRSVQALRGSIEVASKPGDGTTVTLRLPLTLAIIDGLLVRVGEAHFVVPLSNVVECIELIREDIQRMHGRHLVNVRGDLIPYIRLRDYFDIGGSKAEIEQIIIVETRDGRFGFALDEVLGDHQTVIKNLGRLYRHVQMISGATILGDGSIALILDPHRVVRDVTESQSVGSKRRKEDAEAHTPAPLVHV